MKPSNYLKFNDYKILKLNLSYIEDEKNNKELTIKYLYKIKELKTKYSEIEAYQGIKITGNEDFPYDIEILIAGLFELNYQNFSELESLIKANIPAIQYPYLRALVSMISAQTDSDKIILEPMNFSEMLKEKKIEDLLIK